MGPPPPSGPSKGISQYFSGTPNEPKPPACEVAPPLPLPLQEVAPAVEAFRAKAKELQTQAADAEGKLSHIPADQLQSIVQKAAGMVETLEAEVCPYLFLRLLHSPPPSQISLLLFLPFGRSIFCPIYIQSQVFSALLVGGLFRGWCLP